MNDSEVSNQHLNSYLDFYLKTQCPGHAIMINGDWGSGKTHYINSFINSKLSCEIRDVAFISLNGLSSVEQVYEYFFASMIPMLKLKPDGFAVNVLSFFRRKLVSNSESLISGLASFLSAEKIYIFDDVERYVGNYGELFGFFSSLVEAKGARVVIIANEKELLAKVGKDEYENKKEKFLGRVVFLLPDFENSFHSFCSSIVYEREREVIKKRKVLIRAVYEKSSSFNLRVLKQGLIELSHVLACFDDEWLKREKSIDFFVTAFICLFIESSLGLLSIDDLNNDEFGIIEDEQDDKGFSYLEKKYVGVELRPSILKTAFWADVVFKGLVSREYISNVVSKSPYFSDVGSDQEWVILWRWSDFRKEIYLNALSEFNRKFQERKYLELGEVFMAFGLKLGMEDRPYGNISVHEALGECESYLVDYFLNKKDESSYTVKELNLYYKTALRFLINESYGYYGFPKRGSEEFNYLLEVGNDKLQDSIEKVLPLKAKELLAIMVVDAEGFFRKLCSNLPEHIPYFKVPILFYVKISDFVDSLFKMSGASLSTALNAISTRWTFYPEVAIREIKNFKNLDAVVKEYSFKYEEFDVFVVQKKLRIIYPSMLKIYK